MYTDVERLKRIQHMVDEIEYHVTQPRFPDREHELAYALEVMTKAVGLFTKGEEAPDNLELIENNVIQAYEMVVRAHADRVFTSLPAGIVTS